MEPSSSETLIRRAAVEDIPAMCGLLAQLFSIEADFDADPERQYRGLRLLLEEPDRSLVLVAENSGAIVGMSSVQTLISSSEGGPVGLIEDVVVRPDFRGRGIGTSLMSEILEWCEGRGMTRVQLLADRGNQKALDFYLSRGWIHTNLICMRRFTSLGRAV